MYNHSEITNAQLRDLVKNQIVLFGGNRSLKIYGTLRCKSGKRIKKGNRVFFVSVQEALRNGYRPCGHCLRDSYIKWKHGLI